MNALITMLIIVVSVAVSLRQGEGRRLLPLFWGLLMIGAQFFLMGSAMNRLVVDIADIKSKIKTNADAVKLAFIVLPLTISWIYGTWRGWRVNGMNIILAAALSAMVYAGIPFLLLGTIINIAMKIKDMVL